MVRRPSGSAAVMLSILSLAVSLGGGWLWGGNVKVPS